MSTVYLPVEISRRELVAKTMLAGSLAASGHLVLMFRSDLFDRVGWPGPGIYIGKNVFRSAPPSDVSFLKRMQMSGVRIWHLDEEGGIYLGDGEAPWREFLSRRFNPKLLGPKDKVLAWGEWQAEYFSKQELSASVHITGHVNFENCRPDYAEALATFDSQQTSGAENYILVNTRFVLSNSRTSGNEHLMHSATIRGFFDQDLMFDKLVTDGHLYYDFIQMVVGLANRFPDRQIVLRPHPGEDSESYRRVFAPLKNVLVTGQGDVGSWIRRSSCIIHNGCTTAIQATIGGKPVITYMPRPDDRRATACLPNWIGAIAHDLDTVVALINNGQDMCDGGKWRRTISVLDTVEKLTSMVDAEAIGPSAEWALNSARLRCFRFRASEVARSLARTVSPRRADQFKHIQKFFDPTFFGRVPELTKAASQQFSTNLECKKLDSGCFAIRLAPNATRK